MSRAREPAIIRDNRDDFRQQQILVNFAVQDARHQQQTKSNNAQGDTAVRRANALKKIEAETAVSPVLAPRFEPIC